MTRAAAPAAAHRALLAELDRHADHGTPPVCWTTPAPDRGAWTSDDEAEQTLAATLCRTCPALATCRDYGTAHPDEAGVYGGVTEHDRRRAAKARKGAAA